MKNRYIYKALAISIGILSFTACTKDNYEAPAASLSGQIIDVETNEPIPQQSINGGTLQLFQTDLVDNPTSINSVFKSDGSYQNSMLFNGNYKVVINGPFFYDDTVYMDVHGNTVQNLNARAYMHVDTEVSNITSTSATIKVKLRLGKDNDEQKIARVAAVIGTTNSLDINFFTQRGLTDTEAIDNATITSSTYEYTFDGLEPNTTYYVRGGGRTINTGNYYNYAPLIEIKTLAN